ncbi:MAG TPA: P1 family peptidase [Actinomycetota bacterium]|jgi:D-aminopeptidase|nr:P1 family peptidase [Actinomycetota bacterium]
MTRYRDLGLTVGHLPPGPLNAITDVAGVTVGMTTLIEGDGPLQVGVGPVRTGVTAIVPHPAMHEEPLFAASHTLNGNGEMTGLEWVRESGLLTTPIAITNTHSVGVVRDALVAYEVRDRPRGPAFWSLPVVAETYDGALNDINGFHVRAEHLLAAMDAASDGPVAEGGVGGGTGMICHDFKGGTGTASRVVEDRWTVGALVQANHGDRERLAVDGVHVGEEIPLDEVPSAWDDEERVGRAAEGSIIVVLATDAPLLPHQLRRLAQRAALGIARAGGAGSDSSGDIFIAFSTSSAGRLRSSKWDVPPEPWSVEMLPNRWNTPLFWGAIEATEEAILNALVAADTMVGRDGITAHALPHDRLVEIMTHHGRGPNRTT